MSADRVLGVRVYVYVYERMTRSDTWCSVQIINDGAAPGYCTHARSCTTPAPRSTMSDETAKKVLDHFHKLDDQEKHDHIVSLLHLIEV